MPRHSGVRTDHDQVVDHVKSLPAACPGDQPVGALLTFRGGQRPPRPITDEDAGARSAGRGSLEDRKSREPGCLDPADSDDSVTGEAMALIEVQDERDVLPPVPEEVASDRGCRDRVVDPAKGG
jgi:hypothetical protein